MAGDNIKKNIIVRILNKVEGLEKLERQKKTLNEMDKPIKDVSNSMIKNANIQQFFDNQMKRTGKSGAELQKGMSYMGAQFDDMGKVVNMNGKSFKNFNQRLDTATRKSSGFKMEYLGVMFAGMALQRTFSGLNKTAKDWLGISEIVSTTLGVVMLPAMSGVLDQTLKLSEAFMGMGENAQLAVGVSSITFEAAGTIIGGLGQMALATHALQQMFPNTKIGPGNIIKGAVGLTMGITGLAILAGGIKEGDLQQELIGAFTTGIGAAFTASTLGATAAGSIAIGSIAAALAVNIAVSVNYIRNKKTKREDLEEDGFNDDEIDATMSKDVTSETGSLVPTAISRITGAPVEDVALSTTGVTQVPWMKWIGNLFKGNRAVGGNIPQTGMYMMHEGETVMRKDQSQGGQSINITYQVNATSMKEVEMMLRESERRITQDIRRQVR